MNQVQVANILFWLMGFVLFITLLIAVFPLFRKKQTEESNNETLKQRYDAALKRGNPDEIMKEGRKYYASLKRSKTNNVPTITNE